MRLEHLKFITIENAQNLYSEVLAFLKTHNKISPTLTSEQMELEKEPLVLNLAKVETIDSAGLAALIAIIAAAKTYQTKISFINIPDFIYRIAKIHSVEHCLNHDT